MNASPADRTVRKLRTESGPDAALAEAREVSVEPRPAQRRATELATEFLPLARGMSKPLKLLYPYWRDEFESAACLALVEAARSFDPSRSIRFATFARFRIRGALMDVGRAMILPGFEDEDNSPGLVALTPYNEEHGTVLVATPSPGRRRCRRHRRGRALAPQVAQAARHDLPAVLPLRQDPGRDRRGRGLLAVGDHPPAQEVDRPPVRTVWPRAAGTGDLERSDPGGPSTSPSRRRRRWFDRKRPAAMSARRPRQRWQPEP